jgi:citrate lyase alpha subunit
LPLRVYQAPPPPARERRLWGDPREVPPPGAIYWREQFSGVIGPGPASQAVARFTVPPHSRGVVREFSAEINNLLGTSDVTWALRIGGSPVPGWTYRQFPFNSPHVSISLMTLTDRVWVEVPPGSTVDVLITVADATAYAVGAMIAGWTYPQDLDLIR